ncbi:aminopeptidase P family protein [Myxococcus sp. K15C18031901]|uniref:aminopeptidase P family protein n=1 Tax=Myxococcus dinghuensis TaxID=2906761 RepID=UPI0020A83118|nr:aminopeptidase P family protein [Myxococcus dinghuensis]MCP3103803.1 aminopeptidase P family protein [Myxococcus dinghuensis]
MATSISSSGVSDSTQPAVGEQQSLVTSEPQAPAAKPASHDSLPPQALLDFMLTQWKPQSQKLPPKHKFAAAFKARRKALSKAFPGETLVIPTGHEKVRANDTFFRFRPGTDYYYLTGGMEPDCVLVLEPKADGGHTDILFVEPNPGRSNSTFFTDRVKGELWVGPRMGVPESRAYHDIDEVRGLDTLADYLAKLQGAAAKSTRVLRSFSAKVDDSVPAGGERDKALATTLSEMRLVKDAQELRELQVSIDATQRGFEDVIRSLKQQAKSERYVEGVFNLRARVEGNDVGYNTIAASGSHACVLHWTRNDGPLVPGDLLLLDAGVEGHSLYTADITRTLPISGRFSPEQKAIYEVVYAAQEAAFAAARPGNDFMEPNRHAMRVLAQGLEKLGILEDAEEALQDEHQFYKRYSLHNVSHMLGLDVHDCAQARQEAYKYGKLQAGMVLTVEPGLYFQKDDLTVPARYRGIGVRIEDDIVITARGCKVLSGNIPRTVKDVEAWMSGLWKGDKATGAKKAAPAKAKTASKVKAQAKKAAKAPAKKTGKRK